MSRKPLSRGKMGGNRRSDANRSKSALTNSNPTGWNEFITADARDLDVVLKDEHRFDATITSPPYWDLKNYDAKGQIGYRQTLDAYLQDLTKVFDAVWRRTKDGGSLWIVMKTIKKSGIMHLLPFKLVDILTSRPAGTWILQDVLIWHKTHTLPWSHAGKLQDHFEYILCLSKGKSFAMNVDALRSSDGIANWWVKYPERYHPRGKALSNVWELPIPVQGSWGQATFEHCCPLPVELVRRIITLAVPQAGAVLDPFGGTGTTAVGAAQLERKWIAVDLNQKYRQMFYRRLATEVQSKSARSGEPNSHLAVRNLLLRQLKYALLIYKRVAPSHRFTASDIPLIVIKSGTAREDSRPNWVEKCKIFLVVHPDLDAERIKGLVEAVKEQQEQPPLSKFQIAASVSVITKDQVNRVVPKESHLYSQGRFWHTTRTMTLRDVKKLLGSDRPIRFPYLLSDIEVRETPAY